MQEYILIEILSHFSIDKNVIRNALKKIILKKIKHFK